MPRGGETQSVIGDELSAEEPMLVPTTSSGTYPARGVAMAALAGNCPGVTARRQRSWLIASSPGRTGLLPQSFHALHLPPTLGRPTHG